MELKAENLKKSYKDRMVVKGVNLHINSGEIVGLLGPNGAGKTTTLKSMLNFVHPDCGTVEINGHNISTNEFEVKNSIGFVSGLDGFYNTKKIKYNKSINIIYIYTY